MDADELLYPDPGFKSHLGVQQPLWPVDNQEELKRQVHIRCVRGDYIVYIPLVCA